MGKKVDSRPAPGVYRDDPDRNDAASTSSAVLMEDVDYPDSELPAYEDVPAAVGSMQSRYQATQSYVILPTMLRSYTMAELTTSLKIPYPPQPSQFAPIP